MTDTANAPERDDELLPCPFCGGEAWYNIDHTTELCNSVWCRACDFGVFDPNGTGSSVAAWNRRTHCDELVAAAYLDAAQRIEQCLWSQHWYIDGESVDPEDLSEGITKRTPDDARAALTAYGERMKAEGASEAQAKIARLTEAANALVDFHNAPLECKRPDMFQRLISRLAAALRENANG